MPTEPTTNARFASLCTFAPSFKEITDQDLAAYDPVRHPDLKATLRDQASRLHAVAARWNGGTPVERRDTRDGTRQLLAWANQLSLDPQARASHLAQLDHALSRQRDDLRQMADHQRDCEIERRECDRLDPLLAALPVTGGRRPDGYTLDAMRQKLDAARDRLDVADQDVAECRLHGMPDHLATVRGRLGDVREFLIREGALARTEANAQEAPARPLYRPPAPLPARRPRAAKPAPLAALRRQIARAVNTCAARLDSATRSLKRRLTPTGLQQAKGPQSPPGPAALAPQPAPSKVIAPPPSPRNDEALAPVRQEVAALREDMNRAEWRQLSLLGGTQQRPGGAHAVVKHTAGPLLDAARGALASAENLIARHRPAADIEREIATIRSKLRTYQEVLSVADLPTAALRFEQRAWAPGAAPAR
ncbi:hypothetical protein [Mitsuaria sp. GD03876]|uniref:hypothetical protein n=1 Tax=Mitsuaria sp. GD03876 TaxID=2975399 RepID=UPI002447FC2C|nr:hypothetical protein [Mitsuaria sp. GD03876]MDH0863513.1 hypothetical protein [Mitsuaria sp. GD03876]